MSENPKRLFIPGDDWLYYKIYLGTRTSEEFLIREIQPLTKKLLNEGIIDKWFFINFYDSGRHIRLRLHVVDKKGGLARVIQLLKSCLIGYVEKKLCTDIAVGTYKREIERYGASTIDLFENLFFLNSVLVVKVLQYIDGNPEKRWLLALNSIDYILNAWKLDLIGRRNFFHILKESYFIEMGGNKMTKKHLAKKYRENKSKIKNAIEKQSFEIHGFLSDHNQMAIPIIEAIKEKIRYRKPEDIFDFLDSYIHMHCNRLFASRQRMNEWLVYDFLYNFYRSKVAQEKNLSRHQN